MKKYLRHYHWFRKGWEDPNLPNLQNVLRRISVEDVWIDAMRHAHLIGCIPTKTLVHLAKETPVKGPLWEEKKDYYRQAIGRKERR